MIEACLSVEDYEVLTVEDGVRGMQFIQKVVASSKSKTKWTKM